MQSTYDQGYALIIGVGADLPSTINDANGLADILRDPRRCAYRREQVHLITGETATRQNILDAFDRISVDSSAEATVIVYFSGHGYRVHASIGSAYYLMPFGYQIERLYETAISGTELAAKLRAIPAARLVLLLDCCHAGGLEHIKVPGLDVEKAPLPREAAVLFAEGRGSVAICSSQADEYSYAGHPFSAFTLALIEALAGIGNANRDGYVRVADLALHAREMVPQRTDNKQHPILHFEHADNFAVAYYAGGEKDLGSEPFAQKPEIETVPGQFNKRQLGQQQVNVDGGTAHVLGNVMGSVVAGDIDTGGGDFVGRDKHVHN